MRFITKKAKNQYFTYEKLKPCKEKKNIESNSINNKIDRNHESLIYKNENKVSLKCLKRYMDLSYNPEKEIHYYPIFIS